MKKNTLRVALLLGGFLLVAEWASAQTPLTMRDAFAKRAMLTPTSLRQAQWIPGTDNFAHVVGDKIVRVNANKPTSTDTLDVLTGINTALRTRSVEPLSGIPPFEWVSADELWFHTEKEVYAWSLKNGLQWRNSHPADAENIDYQEKNYAAAYTVGNELRVSLGGKEQVVAVGDRPGLVYGKSVHREEFGIYKGTFWSSSGNRLAFYRMDESMVTEYPIYVLDSMPAVARTIRYPYAGATSHQVSVGIFNPEKNSTTYLAAAPGEYLTNVSWSPDDRYVIVASVNRQQDHAWWCLYDGASGALVRVMLEEKSERWVEPEHPVEFVPGSSEQFVLQSERNGFNHLYLYNLDGTLLRQLSDGKFAVTNFYGFSEDGKRCFYQTADESGLNRYVWACTLKSGKSERISTDEGTHNALVSPSGTWVLDVFSNTSTPRNIWVQKAESGAKREVVLAAKNPLESIQTGKLVLKTLQTSGGTPLNARMVLPPTYENGQKYPVIVYVYNGPHVQMVTNTWLGGTDLWMHRLATQGFIVLSVDGRGSAHRGYEFESSIHRHLGDFEMEDQLTAVNYAKTLPYVDASRIGVYGWSYGGFMTTSLMTRPEAKGVFKCGVAGGPVLDWRMYEIMYTERYMDTPQENPDGYAKNSLFNYVNNLDGRLLMIHGSSDPVVLWQHSLRYIRECVRKGKQIDYFVYPEHEHNVTGPDRVHLFEKIELFFKENL
jgi:dipeptidyl-peptidase 4